jgi:hypothetical protein
VEVRSEQDFKEIRKHFDVWRKRFPMFKHDVSKIEAIIETHIQNHSIALVHYRQSRQRQYLERAEHEISEINRVILLAEKAQLMAILSMR